MPRHESFAIENTDRYTATAWECHACASRERKAWNEREGRHSDAPPLFGRFYAVTFDDDD
jgi:hypothetical protein